MNIATQINSVLRRVIDGDAEQTVIVQQRFDTTVADLWDACTTPERLARWFEPAHLEPRVGGRYRLLDSGTEGTIHECEPPSHFVVTWEYGGDVSWVTVSIADDGAGNVMLRLEHQGQKGPHWDRYGPAAGGIGWDESLLALSLELVEDPRARPSEMAKFGGSPEGLQFTRTLAEAWRDAHISAGADILVAQEAANRTVAAYTASSF